MSNRRNLSAMAFALALLVSSSAFATSPTMPVPASHEEFLASLQMPEAPEAGQPALDEVRTEPAPLLKHGYNCTYIGTRSCVPCATGKRMNCDDYRCYYGGVWHTDSICGTCANYC